MKRRSDDPARYDLYCRRCGRNIAEDIPVSEIFAKTSEHLQWNEEKTPTHLKHVIYLITR